MLVAWSPRAGRIVGVERTQDTPEHGFVADDINPHFIAPWDACLKPLPDPTMPEAMARLVVAQTKLMHEKAPGAAAGGKSILAEMTRDPMQIRPVCDLS